MPQFEGYCHTGMSSSYKMAIAALIECEDSTSLLYAAKGYVIG